MCGGSVAPVLKVSTAEFLHGHWEVSRIERFRAVKAKSPLTSSTGIGVEDNDGSMMMLCTHSRNAIH
jgi:hypothetical protein